MDMDGRWTQRNNNETCFGASGAGKTRFYLTPNAFEQAGKAGLKSVNPASMSQSQIKRLLPLHTLHGGIK